MSDRKNEKKKKQKSILEAQILSLVQKSMKAALDMAIDDILKGFK